MGLLEKSSLLSGMSVFKGQVDSVGDMDQVVNPTKLLMHLFQALALAGQVLLFEVISELAIDFLVATSPGDVS